jgi:hypothetical protein
MPLQKSAHWSGSNSKQLQRSRTRRLPKLAPRVHWQHSYTGPLCVYLAEDERAIREHAEVSGFPATRIVEISKAIDPSTARDPDGVT